MNENTKQAIQVLLKKGYKVEVINPFGETFNEIYDVYQDTPMGKKTIIVNENGQKTGMQG